MEFQLVTFFMLSCLICYVLAKKLSNQIDGISDWFLTIENDVSRKQILKKLKKRKILFWVAFALALIVVFQGIYLTQSSYSVNFGISGDQAGKQAAQGMWINGLIVFIPYFLIFIFSFFAYKAYLGANDNKKHITIKTIDKNIKSFSLNERQSYKELMLRRSQEKKQKANQVAQQTEIGKSRKVD